MPYKKNVSPPVLSPCGQIVQRYDKDRYLCSLFAPAEVREHLFAIYAFNHEVAKIREMVSEPMMGMIRLQWWREAIEGIYDGTPRKHEVVTPLTTSVATCHLSRSLFEAVIDARESDLDDMPFSTLEALLEYAKATSANLILLALEVLGVQDEVAKQAATHIGIAWALTGTLRSARFLGSQRRSFIPEGLLKECGITLDDIAEGRNLDKLQPVIRLLAERAEAELAQARKLRNQIPKQALPALLPATIASIYLKRISKYGYDVFGHDIEGRHGWMHVKLLWNVVWGRF